MNQDRFTEDEAAKLKAALDAAKKAETVFSFGLISIPLPRVDDSKVAEIKRRGKDFEALTTAWQQLGDAIQQMGRAMAEVYAPEIQQFTAWATAIWPDLRRIAIEVKLSDLGWPLWCINVIPRWRWLESFIYDLLERFSPDKSEDEESALKDGAAPE